MSLAALDWLRSQRRAAVLLQVLLDLRFHRRRATSGRWPMRCCEALGADLTVFNPAFPTNKRTVYKGYLFVGDELLSESGMRHHPLTPMTDPSLVRVLQRQTPAQGRAGAVRHGGRRGRRPCARRSHALRKRRGPPCRPRFDHRRAPHHAGRSVRRPEAGDRRLGHGDGAARQLHRARACSRRGQRHPLPKVTGPTVVLAGSCSVATQGQVAADEERSRGLRARPDRDRVRARRCRRRRWHGRRRGSARSRS